MKLLLSVMLWGALLAGLTSYHLPSASQPPPAVPPSAQIGAGDAPRVHDPCIIRDGAYYYVFATGPGIPMWRSRDLRRWERAGRVFEAGLPAWIHRELPDSRGAWAPDISYADGRFHLYYAVSRFGSNRSLIALASSRTLDASSPEYGWTDEGKAFDSAPGQTYNAIDPNLLHAPDGHAALTFGSFWTGIQMVFVDAHSGKPDPFAPIVSLARRPSPDAIEAPFLIHHGRYYYLFVSFDYCCRGVNSTYNIRVGRSRALVGPYADRDGRPLLAGGGSLVLGAQGREIGPGHCAILQEDGAGFPTETPRHGEGTEEENREKGKEVERNERGLVDEKREGKQTASDAPSKSEKDYLIYHFYDRDEHGISKLQIRPLAWTPDGWPVAGAPLIASPKSEVDK